MFRLAVIAEEWGRGMYWYTTSIDALKLLFLAKWNYNRWFAIHVLTKTCTWLTLSTCIKY